MLSKSHLTSGCRALGEWPHHRDYLGREDLFLYSSSRYSCHLFLILSVSVRSLPFLSFIVPIFARMFPWSPIFLISSLSFPFYCFPLFLCIVHLRRLSYLSLLVSGTLHSVGYIFPFLIFCFSSFLSSLQSLLTQPLCLLASLLLWNGFDHCLLYSVTNLCP